jgi:hypothetical protein
MALQAVLTDIRKHVRGKSPTLAVYVDLSKAYDTVSHEKLLHKLKHQFNFTQPTLDLFASYFTGRTQSTHTQHAQSTFQTITHGIPQGSTLSTTLFLLYINDIVKTVPRSTVYTYADDTTLVVTAPTVGELQNLAQAELTNLVRYFHTNNLVPNSEKTVYSVFYPKRSEDIALAVNGSGITRKREAKLLGLYVEENLKHHKTVNHIVWKLGPLAHAFRYATRLLPTREMKKLYDTHVYPHLIYALPVWGTDKERAGYLKPLTLMHKRFVRLVRNVQIRAHTKPIMEELEILTLQNLYTLRVCSEMHPFIHPRQQVRTASGTRTHIPPPNRPKHIHHYPKTSESHRHATRGADASHQHLAEDNGHGHYAQRYAAIWNKLPPHLRSISGHKEFTGTLKAYLLANQSSM